MALAISQRHAMFNPIISRHLIYCFQFPEHLYSLPLTMQMPYEHPLLPKVNQMVQMALEGGLFVKWNNDIKRYYTNLNRLHRPHGPRQLTLEHIFPAIVILAIGSGLSILLFLIEILVNRQARRRRCGRLWKILSMLIDGQRHFMKRDLTQRRHQHQNIVLRQMRKRIRPNIIFGRLGTVQRVETHWPSAKLGGKGQKSLPKILLH